MNIEIELALTFLIYALRKNFIFDYNQRKVAKKISIDFFAIGWAESSLF